MCFLYKYKPFTFPPTTRMSLGDNGDAPRAKILFFFEKKLKNHINNNNNFKYVPF